MNTNYKKYISSDWWKHLRQERLKRNNRCQSCGSKNRLHIHHYNYDKKYAGNPQKALKYTKVLCSSCHKAFHDTYGVKKDMTVEMNLFIKENKLTIKQAKETWKEVYDREEWLKNIC